MNARSTLKALFKEILAEVQRNDEFRAQIENILGQSGEIIKHSAKQPARRRPGRFDPMQLHRDRPSELARELETLNLDELKDIIAEHGMDRTKLAMKWKDKSRLIQLIVETVESRAQKGDAFRTPPPDASK